MADKAEAVINDKLLIDRVKGGDATAFDEIVQRYWDRIYSRVHKLLKNHQDAEEVTQDAFVRAHRGLGDFRGDASFSTWLYQIATNLAHNRYWYWWRRKRDASMSLDQQLGDEPGSTLADILPNAEEGPVEETVTQELVDQVAASIPLLSARHREILELRIVKDLSYDEIAKRLSISVGTVKSRIARARESLRELLGSEFK